MRLEATCPKCGYQFRVIRCENMAYEYDESGANIVVVCPVCQHKEVICSVPRD